MQRLKLARRGYFIMSIIFYAAAVFCLLAPEVSSADICVCGGIILVFYGMVKIVSYTAGDLYCLAFQYDLACGVLLLVLGVILLVCAEKLLPFLTEGLGLLALLDGLLTVQMSKDARQFGLKTWNVLLTFAVVTSVLGVLLILKPYLSPAAYRIAGGCTLAAAGVKNQFVMKYAVKAIPERTAPADSGRFE